MNKKMANQHRIGSHKTTRHRDSEGWYNVIYHETPVVKTKNGKTILDSGGWRTNTTKTRMNQASHELGLGYSVFQNKHKWYVEHKGKTVPFSDGMGLF